MELDYLFIAGVYLVLFGAALAVSVTCEAVVRWICGGGRV